MQRFLTLLLVVVAFALPFGPSHTASAAAPTAPPATVYVTGTTDADGTYTYDDNARRYNGPGGKQIRADFYTQQIERYCDDTGECYYSYFSFCTNYIIDAGNKTLYQIDYACGGRTPTINYLKEYEKNQGASSSAVVTDQQPLPVELVAFTGAASGRSARLSWTTASETNNTGFVVERQTGEGAWTDASGLIAGQGTTTERHDYAFEVAGLTAGRHMFRLRQSDTDGTVHHSAPLAMEIGTDGQTVVTVLANGSRSPRVRIEGDGPVRAEAYDVLGRRVGVVYEGAVSGTVEAPLPVGLTAGAYVVRVSSQGRTTSHGVVVR